MYFVGDSYAFESFSRQNYSNSLRYFTVILEYIINGVSSTYLECFLSFVKPYINVRPLTMIQRGIKYPKKATKASLLRLRSMIISSENGSKSKMNMR
jgi:hypothetical protein